MSQKSDKKPGRPPQDEATKIKNRKQRAVVPIQRDPMPEVQVARPGTKIAKLIEALKDPAGKTLTEVTELLSQTGSKVNRNQARTWISYDLCDLKGYGVKSEVEERDTGKKDGEGNPVVEQDLRLWLVLPKSNDQAKVA